MKISDLIVTQNKLEFGNEFQEMVEFVKKGGFFTQQAMEEFAKIHPYKRGFGKIPKLVNIVQFEDGKLFIHDGHHRTGAIFLGGRDYLSRDEYKKSNMLYSQYDEINPAVGYVTPFYPKTEVRLSDFASFKNHSMNLFHGGKDEEAICYIRNNKHLYVVPREIYAVKELVNV